MAEIKGLSYGADSVEFISLNDGTINGDLIIDGDLTVDGEIIVPEIVNGIKIVTFENGTDAEIKTMLDGHYAGKINIEDYWNIGDTRKIHLNGIASPNTNKYTGTWEEQDITIVITTLNHHDLKEKNGIRDKAAVTLQTKECLNNLSQGYDENGCVFVNLNSDYDKTFYRWSQLPLRTWMNGSFLTTCFSTEMQNMIKETKHKRLIQYNANTTEEVIDKLFLPSYPEIFGNAPAIEEGTQWDYYKTSSNRVKKGNNNGSDNSIKCDWWEGSPSPTYSSSDGYYWCYVGSDGSDYNYSGDGASGLAPAFCL